jgi:hypothetical protein
MGSVRIELIITFIRDKLVKKSKKSERGDEFKLIIGLTHFHKKNGKLVSKHYAMVCG